MNNRIDLSLNWTELVAFVNANKDRLYRAKNGKDYLSLTMWPNDVPDQMGNDFSVKPRASKHDIQNRTRLPFVGNGKIAETKVAQSREEAAAHGRQQQQQRDRRSASSSAGGGFGGNDDVPFSPARM